MGAKVIAMGRNTDILKRLQSDHQDRFDALFKSSDILPGRRSRQERDERRARNKQLRDQARGTR